MDISVSHLNRRMALQIPAEFPLGLVFVVGVVEVDATQADEDGLREFYLLEEGHYLLCRLSPRVSDEISLKKGNRIRAGGHIAFDPARARYCLLARDVELLDADEPAASPVVELAAVTHVPPDDELSPVPIPQWVKELAPLEIQEEWAARSLAAASITVAATADSPDVNEAELAPAALALESWREFGVGDGNLAYTAEEPALADLSDELIDFLSEAIDSNDVIELTPAILAELLPAEPPPPALDEEPVLDKVIPEPEPTDADQEASIEEFLSALEAAIAADESDSELHELDPESKNGHLATDPLIPEEDDSPADSQADPDQIDQGVVSRKDPIYQADDRPSVEQEELPKPPQKQAAADPEREPSRKKSRILPWFIALLVILAVGLLATILLVLVIDAGLLTALTG